MSRPAILVARILVAAAWRRRYLLCIPIALVIPAAILLVHFIPKTYVAKSLMLLQERNSDSPFLAKQPAEAESRMLERVAGLQALLKSNRVLTNVLKDISGSQLPNDPEVVTSELEDLERSISLDLIGNEFLEFRLSGPKPKGLGKKLEAVISRFLEALLPDEGAASAAQVFMEQRKLEVEAAERAYSEFKVTAASQIPPDAASFSVRLDQLKQRLQEKSLEATALSAKRDDIRQLQTNDPINLDQDIKSLQDQLASLQARGGGEAELQQARDRLASLMQVKELEAQRASTLIEMQELAQSIDKLQSTIVSYQPIENKLHELQTRLADANARYRIYEGRQNASDRNTGLSILSAPERIKLIDAPQDPEFPVTSSIKFVISGILTGIALGVGLAIGAELLDQSVRRPDEFETLTGLPVVARLG